MVEVTKQKDLYIIKHLRRCDIIGGELYVYLEAAVFLYIRDAKSGTLSLDGLQYIMV